MYKEVPVLCKHQSPHFYEINAASTNARVHAIKEFHYSWVLKDTNVPAPYIYYWVILELEGTADTVPKDSYRFWADLHLEGHV